MTGDIHSAQDWRKYRIAYLPARRNLRDITSRPNVSGGRRCAAVVKHVESVIEKEEVERDTQLFRYQFSQPPTWDNRAEGGVRSVGVNGAMKCGS